MLYGSCILRNESDTSFEMVRASPTRKKFLDFPWTLGSIRPVVFLHKDHGTFYRDVLSNRPLSVLVVLAFIAAVALSTPIFAQGMDEDHST